MRATAKPAVDATVRLRDGRRVAYAEWGDPLGRPVVLLHGSLGSRLFCPDEGATKRASVRLITIDRPGYGGSDPAAHRSYLDWAPDLVELVQHLELPPLPVVGWSGGGPYALACAFAAPEHVSMVGLASSPGPLDEVPGVWESLDPDTRGLVERLRRDPEATAAEIEDACRWFADDWRVWHTDPPSNPDTPDERLFADAATLDALNDKICEGARQGSKGLVGNQIAVGRPWGFAISDVRQPVQLWWGDADTTIGRAHTDYLAQTIPRAILTVYPGDGHFFPIKRWAEMLRDLAPG